MNPLHETFRTIGVQRKVTLGSLSCHNPAETTDWKEPDGDRVNSTAVYQTDLQFPSNICPAWVCYNGPLQELAVGKAVWGSNGLHWALPALICSTPVGCEAWCSGDAYPCETSKTLICSLRAAGGWMLMTTRRCSKDAHVFIPQHHIELLTRLIFKKKCNRACRLHGLYWQRNLPIRLHTSERLLLRQIGTLEKIEYYWRNMKFGLIRKIGGDGMVRLDKGKS